MKKKKVFISWSGDEAKQIASALREWLGDMLHETEPWFSAKDIEAGQWGPQIGEQLEEVKFGIACIAGENWNSNWLNYECGACASKAGGKLWVYRHETKHSEVKGPLSLFQHVETSKEGTFALVEQLNKCLSIQLGETKLKKAFTKWWPDLKKKLDQVTPEEGEVERPPREAADLLEEILDHVRRNSRVQERLSLRGDRSLAGALQRERECFEVLSRQLEENGHRLVAMGPAGLTLVSRDGETYEVTRRGLLQGVGLFEPTRDGWWFTPYTTVGREPPSDLGYGPSPVLDEEPNEEPNEP